VIAKNRGRHTDDENLIDTPELTAEELEQLRQMSKEELIASSKRLEERDYRTRTQFDPNVIIDIIAACKGDSAKFARAIARSQGDDDELLNFLEIAETHDILTIAGMMVAVGDQRAERVAGFALCRIQDTAEKVRAGAGAN
jgi:hypothetical protein